MFKISPNDPCPCLSGEKYKKCCRPVHVGQVNPEPVRLMRARFSAYALAMVDFIMLTTHPESPHSNPRVDRWGASLESYCMLNKFAALDIISSQDHRVTYTASIESLSSGLQIYTEDAEFRQIDGRWMYYDGILIPQSDEPPQES